MLSLLFYAIRPKTLSVALSVILLGQLLAWFDLKNISNDQLDLTLAFLCLLCCLFLQISVNLANDYFDHVAGIDGDDRKGPVRAIQSGALTVDSLKKAIATFTLLAMASGSYLIWIGGWVFFLLGSLALAGVFLYSGGKYSLASRSLGEIAAFLFFGWLGVVGSYYLQVQQLGWELFIPASELGLLIAAIMLVNNIRDIKTDAAAGKITLAYRLGPNMSRIVYGALLLLPFVLLINNPYLPWFNTLLLPLHLGFACLIHRRSSEQLNTQLAQTSFLVLTWSLGYLVSFLFGLTMG